jgi:Major Facilitator Superfamily.
MSSRSSAPTRTGDSRLGPGFMTALVVASILNPLNTSSLATALASITTDMHATAGQGALLVAAVYITSAVAQPVMGTLSTRLGAWRVLVVGPADGLPLMSRLGLQRGWLHQ